MSIVFATLAAFSNACTSILQRRASVLAPTAASARGWRHGLYLLRRPMWLAGAGFMAAGFACAAVALYFGQLALVQPLLVSELVFTLALRRWWLRDPMGPKPWAAAIVTSAGLAALLVVMSPGPGREAATTGHWAVAVLSRVALAVLLLALGRTGSPGRRAALHGSSAAVLWSLDAAFTKATAEVLRDYGWLGVPAHWPLYPLVATGILGTVVTQAAFRVGPLSASQPALVIVDPLMSIVLGVQLFGEQISTRPLALFADGAAFAVMAVGVVLTSMWAPPATRPVGAGEVHEPVV
jgi:hypothetical protein